MKLAVIPARGGSKRIPRKNIRKFFGKPIIAYSIEQAISSTLFDHVIVSTDDQSIASVAREYGAETPFVRPADLSDDYTGTNAVVKHAIEWYQRERGKQVSLACCIYATAPFIKHEYLKDGHDKLVKSDHLFAFSVTDYAFPIQRALRMTENGEVDAFSPECITSRSQDLEKAYHDAGQFYWGKAHAFLEDAVMFSKVSIPVMLPRIRVQDIDNMDDWKYAEMLYQLMAHKDSIQV